MSILKNVFSLSFIIPSLAAFALASCQATGADSNWTLVWSEEFDAPSLNTKSWNIETGSGYGEEELQYYTSTDQVGEQNLKILQDGTASVLRIAALNNSFQSPEGTTYPYTSARITTQGNFSFTHGKIEARMKLPYGRGIWPAFWMLGEALKTHNVPWPRCGEIDIMEFTGGTPHDEYLGLSDSVVYGTLHWGDELNRHFMSSPNGYYKLASGRFADNYHVFGVQWGTDGINWSVDGKTYFSQKLPSADYDAFQLPFFLILNLAVGGTWPGPPDATTVFPQYLYIDWIRVYQEK